MTNIEIIKILREDEEEITIAGFSPEYYRSSFQGKELVILAIQVLNGDSCFRKTIREIRFNTKQSADKLYNEIKSAKRR